MVLRLRQMELSSKTDYGPSKTVYGPMLKNT